MVENTFKHDQRMKLISKLFTVIMVVMLQFVSPAVAAVSSLSTAQQEEAQQTNQSVQDANDPNCVKEIDPNGNVAEFRDSYVPVQYNPTPEYMVFVDMGVLIVIMLVGVFFVMKRKASWKLSMLAIIALAYLGIIRGGCICPVGVITNVTMGMVSPRMVGLVTLVVFLSPLIVALFAGRVFCTSGCPLGAMQHIFQKKKKLVKIPQKLNTIIKIFPIALLVGTIYFALKSSYFLACELEPYKAVFFIGKSWFEQLVAFIAGQPMEAKLLWSFGFFAWGYLLVMMVIGYWFPRPFCRFMCPYGVLLGVFSFFSVKQRRIDNSSCIHCGACQKVCPTQAIVIDRKTKISSLSNYDCVQCNKCTDSCKSKAIK
jgi:polyferredoxin